VGKEGKDEVVVLLAQKSTSKAAESDRKLRGPKSVGKRVTCTGKKEAIPGVPPGVQTTEEDTPEGLRRED